MYDEANVRKVDYRLESVPQEVTAGNGDEFAGARVPPECVVRVERGEVQVSHCERENEECVCE